MGTLHLEIANTLITKTGMEIVTSKPIVIYREAVRRNAGPVEGKSPNKHNKIYIEVEPLEDAVLDLIKQGKLSEYGDRRRWLRPSDQWDGSLRRQGESGALTSPST